ncbi:hypothetical protein [Streptomyces sp. RK9]|uniref:hypothetical protein n=1 Tax=Streptomyces sp. RK9 TaxID=3239284 RepID=UPI003866A4FB
MSIEESWEKIECWLTSYASQEEPLPGPCTRADLDRLYAHVGARLPEDVERSLLRHNGSGLTDVLPPSYGLHSVEAIAKKHADWMQYKDNGDSPLLVPIGSIGVLQLMVDTRTGHLENWDLEQGYIPEEGPVWESLSAALESIGNVLASPRPWFARGPYDDEWAATDMDPDFPGMLVWAQDR